MKIGIVGGGIAGLFTAWFLSRAGEEVILFDKGECGHGCSWDAAGMLAPVNELEFQELELLRAGVASRQLYLEIEKELGDIGLVKSGTLEVGLTADDESYLKRLYAFQKEQGLPVEWLTGEALRQRESFLSRKLPCGIWSPEDIQVDNRKLVEKLAKENLAMGVSIHDNELVESAHFNEIKKVVASTGKGDYDVDALVVATGTGTIPGLKSPFKVYPVRGEMLALEAPEFPFLEKTVRIRNKVFGNAYVVPKEGRILCGSTSEEQGSDPVNTAGGLLDILRKCYAAVPGIYELSVVETWAGLRPSTLSRQPVLDREKDRPIYHLNGLYRHGILLGPLLGKAMAQLIVKGDRMPEVDGFRLPE